METLLTLLLLLALWLGPKVIEVLMKRKKEKVVTPPLYEEEEETEEGHFETRGTSERNMQEKEENSPKEPDYFTYERDAEEVGPFTENDAPLSKTNLQTSDNENKIKTDLHLDEEEVYKGVIYSEILKRKFN